MNITGNEIFDHDMDDTGNARVDYELEPLNVVEESTHAGDKMEIDNNLGFLPDVNPKINGSSQNNENAGSPPLSPRTPPSPPCNDCSSPDNYLSDCGSSSSVGSNFQRASDLLMAVSVSADVYKMKITKLVIAAMEELTKMALKGEPLWQLQKNGKTELLNDVEYMRQFGHVDATLKEIMKMVEVREPPQWMPSLGNTSECSFESGYKPISCNENEPEPLRIEASRETGHVRMNPIGLVEMLMDLKQWSLVFSNIVSKAMILGILSSTGKEGNYDGTLQVMTAEFHVPSPLVPVRESYFARYCKQVAPGTWGIVDISLEKLFSYPLVTFRRRPSGCLIQEMPNGYSKVIWIEHVEVDNGSVHKLFQPLVASGFAFGAKRWVNTIVQQCVRLATLMARSTPTDTGVVIPQCGRTGLLKLSERMMRTFCIDVCASASNLWMPIPRYGAEDMRIMTKHSKYEPGIPPGPSVVFATSVQIPASRKRICNFLQHANSRNKWDILSYGYNIKELAYIINGEDPGNRISIIQVINTPVLYLQESYSDSTGSYVVYAPMDAYAMSIVLNGGDPDAVAILPSGFAILPDKPTPEGEENSASLLTLGFHIIDGASTKNFIPSESIDMMHQILTETSFSIMTALISPKH
ncbi:hypothetical protein ACB098_06G043100 [Castanea mollissima]